MHRAPLREPSPLLRRNIFARAVADGKLFTGAGRFVVDRDRRYVRIRLHLRFVFLGQLVKSPGRRPLRTYQSIQAVLSDSHIDDFCPRGADFREKGGSAIESACRARICRSSSPAAPASCEMPGSLPHVTGSDAGRARFTLPLASMFSTRCLPRRSLARPWRCHRPLATSRAQFSARRRAALPPRACNLHGAQFSIDFTFPALSLPKRKR